MKKSAKQIDDNAEEKLFQRSTRFTGNLSSFDKIAFSREFLSENVDDDATPSCTDMCPLSECLERERCLDVHPLEADDKNGLIPYESIAADVHRKIDIRKAVKKFRRPAAGTPPQKFTEIRTPETIMRTLFFLMGKEILGRASVPLSIRANFIRDRGRALRSDLARQPKVGREVIEVGLTLARFHALVAHELCQEDRSEFDPFQNAEQLSKTLTTLSESIIIMNETERIEVQAMKILNQIDDISFAFSSSLSGVESWAYSLLVAYRINDASGWIRRAIEGPPNCSPTTTLILCSFAHAHLSRMRLLLLEQLISAFSNPMPQTISIGDLLFVFGFADLFEARAFFSQFAFFNEGEDSVKFSKESSLPDSILPIKSRLLVGDKLNNLGFGFDNRPNIPNFAIAATHYERSLQNAIVTPPNIDTSNSFVPLVVDISISHKDPQINSKDLTLTPLKAPSPELKLRARHISEQVVSHTLKQILFPFISSALQKRELFIRDKLGSSIQRIVIQDLLLDLIIKSYRRVFLLRKFLSKWRYFSSKQKVLSDQLSALMATPHKSQGCPTTPRPLISFLTTEDDLVCFYKFLFTSPNFEHFPLRIEIFDWFKYPALPRANLDLASISLYTTTREEKGQGRRRARKTEKAISLFLLFIDSNVSYRDGCQYVKTVRACMEEADLLFLSIVYQDFLDKKTVISPERSARLVGISPFHIGVFPLGEFSEQSLIDRLKVPLGYLMTPGNTVWIESDSIFERGSFDGVIDSDFWAYLSECPAPALESWRSCRWYRRYLIVDSIQFK